LSPALLIFIGGLSRFVRYLLRLNGIDNSAEGEEAKNAVARGIERLIFQMPDEKIFEGNLARFGTMIRAARRFQMEHHGPEFVISMDEERCKFWFSDAHGHELLIVDCTDGHNQHSLSCVTHSRIADCALALWNAEEESFGGGATSLYRVPTRKELREYLCLNEPAVTKLCRAQGFEWLPRAGRAPTNPKTGEHWQSATDEPGLARQNVTLES
jgi:hypothetical protein